MSFLQLITQGMVSPDGLAVDWIGKNLYWTDYNIDIIGVANAQGRNMAVLHYINITAPRAIVVDPSDRY